jgi:hypothetical protein
MEHSNDPKWEAWFFRKHPRAELAGWTARLRFFRFWRALGGLANDGDTLRCALCVETERELFTVTQGLGIPLQVLPPDAPTVRVGQSYTLAEMRRLPSRMERFPQYAQLGRVTLAKVECLAQVWLDRLVLQVFGAAGDPFEVSEADVENAAKIEELIVPLSHMVVEAPVDSEYCFRGR